MLHPVREKDSQSAAMGNVIHGRHRVFDVVRCPIPGKTHVQHIVQCHRSTVENGFAKFIVFQIFNEQRRRLNHRPENRLAESELNRRVGVRMEIMLEDVRHHIYHAVDGLIQRNGIRMDRIEDRKRGIGIFAEPGPFLLRILIGDDRTVVHL
ncbi:hypothetical protein D1872_278290 [compost metagenome]